jgi:phosphoribosylformylglycinamidine synthase subunit PurS
MRWTVTTLLRPGVKGSDEGVVLKCLHDLGYVEASELRIGKVFFINIDDALTKDEQESKVHDMCKKMLVNTVLYNYTITEEF